MSRELRPARPPVVVVAPYSALWSSLPASQQQRVITTRELPAQVSPSLTRRQRASTEQMASTRGHREIYPRYTRDTPEIRPRYTRDETNLMNESIRYTLVEGNLAREIGLYEKQSSFYVQAKASPPRPPGSPSRPPGCPGSNTPLPALTAARVGARSLPPTPATLIFSLICAGLPRAPDHTLICHYA